MEIFDYVDYRSFLKDAIADKKKKNKAISLRLLAKKAGFSSPGYIQSILSGNKNLRCKSAVGLTKALQLRDTESQYFCHLVEFNQAQKLEKKIHHIAGMQALVKRARKNAKSKIFSIQQSWYNLVILELAHCPNFSISIDSVFKIFSGRVSIRETQTAIFFLKENGFLIEHNGRLCPTSNDELHTTDEINSIYVKEIHRKSSQLAAESLNLPLEDREFQNITIALSNEKLIWLKQRLKQLRHELISELANDPKPEKIFHVNLQAFPVTEFIK